MENSLYVGLSSQVVLQENMNIIANNVANLNTPGFRGQNMIFQEYLERERGMKEDLSLVNDYGQYQVTDPGPVKVTGNPLDVALIGPGFLGIQTPGGVQYTRSGNLAITAEGTLVNARGMLVASAGGGSITIPPDAKNVYIDQNGAVSTDDGQVGQLMIAEFNNYQTLNPTGNGLYETTETAIPAKGTTVIQGKLEGSNVQAVVEMTRMIDVLREYQSVQNMMKTEHDRLRTAIQKLTSQNG
jgi:flagellar basal-body rod protein FlgF